MSTVSKKALIILATGAEEMELVITSDVLRRGGVEVTVAGMDSGEAVQCARKTLISPDDTLINVKDKEFDAVILPGGQPGSNNLAASTVVGAILNSHHAANKYVAAICAAPIALKAHNISPGTTITSYPGVKEQLVEAGYKYSEELVVVSGNVVTSRGPGTAFLFALKLVELLVGHQTAKQIADTMLVKYDI